MFCDREPNATNIDTNIVKFAIFVLYGGIVQAIVAFFLLVVVVYSLLLIIGSLQTLTLLVYALITDPNSLPAIITFLFSLKVSDLTFSQSGIYDFLFSVGWSSIIIIMPVALIILSFFLFKKINFIRVLSYIRDFIAIVTFMNKKVFADMVRSLIEIKVQQK